jgi:hypothetical protein
MWRHNSTPSAVLGDDASDCELANVLAEHMGRETAPAPLVFNSSSPFSQSSASARRADCEPQLAVHPCLPLVCFVFFEMAMTRLPCRLSRFRA